MRIKNVQIKNFKSLVDFELKDIKPFCAFVGPNASGKSNIFEALEFTNYVVTNSKFNHERINLSYFGGKNILSYFSKKITQIGRSHNPGLKEDDIAFFYDFENSASINFYVSLSSADNTHPNLVRIGKQRDPKYGYIPDVFQWYAEKSGQNPSYQVHDSGLDHSIDYEQFIDNFSRVFVNRSSLLKFPVESSKLALDGSNLSSILSKIFQHKDKREDFIDWLNILIPEFENVTVRPSTIDGTDELLIYEKKSIRPFPSHLISDGTYSILSLMAVVYQTDSPQFICIEEPENGLHPHAIERLVDFFREKCSQHGHHIWLNTHSQTLVRCLDIEEIILIDKVNGITKVKQMTKEDNINIRTDEAWLSNALGGGIL